MNIFAWVILGLIAGAIAKLLMGSSGKPKGCLSTIILGIVGGVLGGYLGSKFLGIGKVDGLNRGSLFVSVGGAVLVLWVFAMISKK